MSDLRAYQPSFTAGELSPALWARVDLAKYASGLKTARNLFVHPHGGVSNRAGLEFVAEIKDSSRAARLLPFQFNTEQTYIIEAGQNYFRFFRDGGVILNGGSPYEVATPYTAAKLEGLGFTQENDVAYLTHEDYAPRKLSRLAETNWTIGAMTFAPSTAAPTGLGGTAYFVRRRGNTADVTFKVTALSSGGAESAASAAATLNVQYETEDGRRNRLTWNASPGAATYRIYRSDDNIGIIAETTEREIELSQTQYRGDGTPVPGSSASGAPGTPTGLSAQVVYGELISYKVATVSADTGEESLPSAAFKLRNDLSYASNKNTLTWPAVAGAEAYIVYKEHNGVYGYIGRTETTDFTDNNIVADTTDGPQSGFNPFNGAGKYPRCAAFCEQRLTFGGSKNEPQGVWMSQSANYENFSGARPAKVSDAVIFRIKSEQANEIRALIALRGLMVLTSGAEFVVSGGANGEPIDQNPKIDPQGYRGAARVQPIKVGNTILFAQNRGGVVRDFSYEFANDSFTGRDLTILARHMFDGREIKAWAYAQAPWSIVWVVMDDGSLISLTYLKEHEVWAWTRHASGPNDNAVFEDVCVIAEGAEDVPYFIVKRRINGVDKRYIERLHSRAFTKVKDAFFVDCGLTYEGPAATVISGLGHLEGESVVALADGNVVRNLTVSGGSVTLPNAAKKVHVGLPMTAALQTLDLDLGEVRGLGTVQGRMKSVSELTMRVQDTRGIWTGPKDGGRDDADIMVEYKQRATEAWNEAIKLYTGDIAITPHWDWSAGGNMWVKQFDPLPMTILALMPDVTLGR